MLKHCRNLHYYVLEIETVLIIASISAHEPTVVQIAVYDKVYTHHFKVSVMLILHFSLIDILSLILFLMKYP